MQKVYIYQQESSSRLPRIHKWYKKGRVRLTSNNGVIQYFKNVFAVEQMNFWRDLDWLFYAVSLSLAAIYYCTKTSGLSSCIETIQYAWISTEAGPTHMVGHLQMVRGGQTTGQFEVDSASLSLCQQMDKEVEPKQTLLVSLPHHQIQFLL